MTIARNYIAFIHNNETIQINFAHTDKLSPNTTLLQYLRNNTPHKGTKEGCAQGDCGACTVVLAELSANGIVYKACNACLILLPQIHGKWLITVENLDTNNQLHPVQKAIVDLHASQCGFCTPGFTMSLFALYKSNSMANDQDIEEAFAGNLCRCTGYESLKKAAKQGLSNLIPDKFSQLEASITSRLKAINNQSGYLIAAQHTCIQPITINEALEFYQIHPHFEILGGATDMALRITKRNQIIPNYIDLSQITELKNITKQPNSYFIGSMVTMQTILETIAPQWLVWKKLLTVFGSKQIRNLATLGGNLATCSPIGDTWPLLMVLNTQIVLKSYDHDRKMTINNFITGYHKTELKPNEIIYGVEIPLPEPHEIIDIEKASKRIDLDISSVSVAMRLTLNQNNTIKHIKLVFGGMAETVKNAVQTEQFLINKPWNIESMNRAGEYISFDFNPISDARATAEGRLQLAKNLLIKLWANQNTP